MRRTLFLLLVAFTFSACGSKNLESSENIAISKTQKRSIKETNNNDEIISEYEELQKKDSRGRYSSACLTGSCEAPPNAAFEFLPSSVIMDSCAVSKVDVIIAEPGFRLFFLGICERGNEQLYTATVTKLGQLESSPILVSDSCLEQGYSVLKFDVGEGDGQYFTSYTCGTSLNSWENKPVYFSIINSNSVVTKTEYITNEYRYTATIGTVKWNPESSTWGYFGDGWQQLYDFLGNKKGGRNIGPKGIHHVKIINGSWVLLSKSAHSAITCSRLSSTGVQLCLEKSIKGQTYLDKSRLIAVNQSGDVYVSYLNSDTCDDNGSALIGSLPGNYIGDTFNSLVWSQDVGLLLYSNQLNSLAVSSFGMSGAQGILSTTSAISYNEKDLDDALLLTSDNMLYVFSVIDSVVYLSLGIAHQ